MDLSHTTVTDRYRERIERLGLFDCLYTLENKKTKDHSGQSIDFFSLGFLTLLFFFENMLVRNHKTGVKELANFLYGLNQEEIDLEQKDFESIARTIINVFRPPGGKRNQKTFYNWETRQKEVIEYSYLKASKSDLKSNTQYYTLDEHGLELVFATKEYFSEFQLSINQLLLRKQLEKGEFVGALRQIDEMRIDVESLEERIIKIKHEVQRNILSEKTYERYRDLIEDINNRLKRENDEFDELVTFVNETRETLSYEIKDEKEQKAYGYIINIQKTLGEVHRFHRNLLQKSIELKTTTLQSAQESLYYVGIESFNFRKEIVSRMFSSPLPLETSRMLIKPLLSLEKQQTWSPLTVFAPQRIGSKEDEDKTTEFYDIKAEDIREQEMEIQQKNYATIITILLEALGTKNEITLEAFIHYIKQKEYTAILDQLTFYHFFITLHQKSPIKLNPTQYDNERSLKRVIEILEKQYVVLNVVEAKGVIHVNNRFTLGNMIIRLEEKAHAL
ncbi:hypothetical protein EDC19_1348 [Natranaerovirga hydrolytica]|uniref:Replicative DNA helicase n=1 Tax=Natranaerovirga hydrolytica TaxID=680378 RepID=A0A4V2Q0B7_9FIRM|nr:replicative DNA helicase [Natranaerovirga hydrolytica]TCK93161.1 hypothetical protein EDC19_1348 [Natranaerovirga hydrolytica]